MTYEDFLQDLLPDASSWAIEIVAEELKRRDDRITELLGQVEDLGDKKNGK